MLGSAVKAWHCAAAELLGRLILNPENESFLMPFAPKVNFILHIVSSLTAIVHSKCLLTKGGWKLQIYKRLVEILSFPAGDSQAAAVGALYNLAEVNMDCRLKLATERWLVGWTISFLLWFFFGKVWTKHMLAMYSRAVDRLLKVIKTPHPVPEICRKATLILENLVLEPQNKPLLLAYENAFVEMVFSENRYTDAFARILFELTSRPSNRVAPARGIWGM